MSSHQGILKVAIASDFLTSFSKVPRGQQAKVMDFISRFKANPASPGINYEKIERSKDPNLRSVRIDQNYRGIVLKPETGNVYVLLWVDHHDKAYRWAESKRYAIHPETGSLQVVDIDEPSSAKATQPRIKSDMKGMFAEIADRDLLRLGVPEQLLALIRTVYTDDDLDNIEARLPQEASEALYMLAAGYSFEDVLRETERPQQPVKVDTDDFETALTNPDSQRRFFIIADDLELAAILNEPLEKWRVFLHPSQRRLVERNWNGPVRVLGGAGTGKTVVAMHRARWLAQNVVNKENDKILFTTFTRNLAADIRANLTKICSKDAMRRIEIINLDRWVSEFLQKNGYPYKIDYGSRTSNLWQQALTFAPPDPNLDQMFYREEWERIIQPQEITTLDAYVKASRLGRGVRLGRKERARVWPVFEEYRLMLNEHGLREGDDAMRDARLILAKKEVTLPYQAIIVDEAQDMGPQAFKLLRELLPADTTADSLFIVGDGHQRIYRRKVVLGKCGIDIRGRSRKLKINYRTTEEIRRWAVRVLEGLEVDDLDGGQDDQKGYKSLLHGPHPQKHSFSSFNEEVTFIADYLIKVESEEGTMSDVCLVTRTNDLIGQYEASLQKEGIRTCLIHRNEPENRSVAGVRLATMHRVKGLEFDRVIVAGVNEGIIPFDMALQSSDTAVKKELEAQERALLYVAVTRAKKEVVVTSFGVPSPFLRQ